MSVPHGLANCYPPPDTRQPISAVAQRALLTARTLGPATAFVLATCALTTYGITTYTQQLSVMSVVCGVLVALLGTALLLYAPHRSLSTRHDGITLAQRLWLLSLILLPLTSAMLL
ncbi:MAG: hypothetical protein H7Y32_13420, partial [Chloroflexales bacterium]|nr:hypothetical protein [Chloroflexales bacterium]